MMNIKTLTMSVVMIILGGLSFFFGSELMKTSEKMYELEVSKDDLREPQVMDLKIEQMKTNIDRLPFEGDINGYANWNNLENLSEHMYMDSEGLFKKDWGIFLTLKAEKKGIDPFIVYELLNVETGGTFDPELVGPETRYGHAYGLAQFMKNTGPWIAEMADLPYGDEKLFDPYYSIQLSVVYLDFLHDLYGDWDHALTAYHRGMYGLETYIDNNGNAKSAYAVLIQENAEIKNLVALD